MTEAPRQPTIIIPPPGETFAQRQERLGKGGAHQALKHHKPDGGWAPYAAAGAIGVGILAAGLAVRKAMPEIEEAGGHNNAVIQVHADRTRDPNNPQPIPQAVMEEMKRRRAEEAGNGSQR